MSTFTLPDTDLSARLVDNLTKEQLLRFCRLQELDQAFPNQPLSGL